MIATQSSAEYDVRAGNVYTFGASDSDLDTTETFDIAIKTPATGSFEIVGEYEAFGGTATVAFYSGATLQAATGSAVTVTNSNDLSTKTSGLVVLLGPTVTAPGTLKRSRTMFASATVPAKSTSGIGDVIPRVLAPNTQYLLRMTGAVNDVSVGAYLRVTKR